MKLISTWIIQIKDLRLAPYCLVAGISAIIGSFVLTGTADYLINIIGLDTAKYDVDRILQGPAPMFYLLIYAPVTETFFLAGLLKLFSIARFTPGLACGISALLWGVLHGISEPARFFGTGWSFYIFGAGYLLWQRHSFQHAFTAAAAPHMILNSAVVLLVGLTGGA